MKENISEVEGLSNSKKEFERRVTYLESVSKNIVTQAEYRNDTVSKISIFLLNFII